MKTVKQLLSTKESGTIYSVTSENSVFRALRIMMEKNISSLLIIEQEQLLGIFTEKDYARKIVLHGKKSENTPLRDVMTSNLITVSLNDTIDHCMKIMTEERFRHLPVLDNNKVVGMISIGDVVKFIIEDQKETISQLQNYISS